jgi:hypothetical protein
MVNPEFWHGLQKRFVTAQMAKENKGEPEVEQEDEEEYPVPQCPLHEAVAVQPSPMGGRGLFALRDFAAGDGELCIAVRLWPWTSTPFLHCEESERWSG